MLPVGKRFSAQLLFVDTLNHRYHLFNVYEVSLDENENAKFIVEGGLLYVTRADKVYDLYNSVTNNFLYIIFIKKPLQIDRKAKRINAEPYDATIIELFKELGGKTIFDKIHEEIEKWKFQAEEARIQMIKIESETLLNFMMKYSELQKCIRDVVAMISEGKYLEALSLINTKITTALKLSVKTDLIKKTEEVTKISEMVINMMKRWGHDETKLREMSWPELFRLFLDEVKRRTTPTVPSVIGTATVKGVKSEEEKKG